jgi:hypothetical protein
LLWFICIHFFLLMQYNFFSPHEAYFNNSDHIVLTNVLSFSLNFLVVLQMRCFFMASFYLVSLLHEFYHDGCLHALIPVIPRKEIIKHVLFAQSVVECME